MYTVIFGRLINVLNDPFLSTGDVSSLVRGYALDLLYIAVVSGCAAVAEGALPKVVAERLVARVRGAYVDSLLRQDAAYFDGLRAGEAPAALLDDSVALAVGLERVPALVKSAATAATAVAIGFAGSWKLTLVILGCAAAGLLRWALA